MNNLKLNNLKLNNLKLNTIKTKVDLSKLVLDDKKILGSGAFGHVYKAYNGKNMNNRLVAKKTFKSVGLQLFSLIVNGHLQGTMFKKEVDALKYLSKLGIAPKIYFSDEDKMIYVIEKLDYTLTEMLRKNKFKAIHLKRLADIFKLVKTTPFKHNDLHSSNIMYSEKKNKFYIIDWGIFNIEKSCMLNTSTKKSKKTKAKNCYNFNKTNVVYLSDLFLYINKKKKTDKQMYKNYKLFLELFVLDN